MKGILGSRPLPSFRISRVHVPRRQSPSLPFRSTLRRWRRHFFVGLIRRKVPTPPAPLSLFFFREIKRHVEATWTRSADEHIAGDISRHLWAQPWRYTACLLSLLSPPLPPFPPLSSRPSNSPYFGLSFSRSRERVLARASGENASLCLPRWARAGGRNDYLLTFTRATSYARKSSTAAWVPLS